MARFKTQQAAGGAGGGAAVILASLAASALTPSFDARRDFLDDIEPSGGRRRPEQRECAREDDRDARC